MIHIILLILKIIGILLLVILGILILLLLLLLFYPVTYRVKGKREDGALEGSATLGWLFGLFRVTLLYQKSESRIKIRILGIPYEKLRSLLKKRKRVSEAHSDMAEIKKNDTIAENSPNIIGEENDINKDREKDVQTYSKCDPVDVEKTPEEKKEKEKSKANDAEGKATFLKRIKNTYHKLLASLKKIWNKLKKTQLTIAAICDKIKRWKSFLERKATKRSLAYMKDLMFRLLRHIRPRKISGYLEYGFEDPSQTGQILGLISMCYPYEQNGFQVIPHFEKSCLAFSLKIKGRIYGCVLLKMVVDTIRNKAVMKTIRVLRHKEE